MSRGLFADDVVSCGLPAGSFVSRDLPADGFVTRGLPAGNLVVRGLPAGNFVTRGLLADDFVTRGLPAGSSVVVSGSPLEWVAQRALGVPRMVDVAVQEVALVLLLVQQRQVVLPEPSVGPGLVVVVCNSVLVV